MRAILIVLTLVGLGVAAFGFALGWNGALTRRDDPATLDAYVSGDRTPLSSQLSGYVRTVLVMDNAPVRAGQTVVEMDDDDERASAAQAQAQADAARAAVEALQEKRAVLEQQVLQAREDVISANAQLAHAFNEVRRQQVLVGTPAGLLQALQTAQADERRLEATRDQSSAQAEADERQLSLLAAQTAQAEAQIREAEASLKLAQIALGYTRITTPIAGVLGERLVHDGALLAPGTQVDTVTPLETLWVTANFTERQITNIRVGQRAEVRVDAFRAIPLTGKVAGVQPATGSQFSEVPADNTTGNFTKVVQRIPVKIALDLRGTKLAGLLRPGMSARVEVFTTATKEAGP